MRRITVHPLGRPDLAFCGSIPRSTDVAALLARIEALCAAGLPPSEAVRRAWPTEARP